MAPRTISKEQFDHIVASNDMINESAESPSSSLDDPAVTGVDALPSTSTVETPPVAPIVVQPPAAEPPTVNVQVQPSEVQIRPQIIVQAPDVIVQPTDMSPVADAMDGFREAILESIGGLAVPTPSVQVAAPEVNINLQPVAEAINNMAEAITSKADHGEAIKDLLQQIANRPQNAKWKFLITRDARGDIETMEAVKEMTA